MALTNFNKTISWRDFPNPLPPGRSEDAVISVTWDIDPTYATQGNAVILASYIVNVFLVKDDCAVVTSVANGPKSAELLKHEQGHFDIIALGAREFHSKVAGLTAATEKDLDKKIKDLSDKIGQKADIVDARYDTVTNHSINTQVQQTWNLKIDAAKKNAIGTVDNLP